MPNISEKAVLVTLKISQFTKTKEDKSVSKEVEEAHKAKNDAGKYQKLLLSKEVTKEIQKIAGRARTFHYERTLPWGDEGTRLLPAKWYMDYISEMKKLEHEFNMKVFELDYQGAIEEAKQRLGDMFNENEYPDQKEFQEEYSFNYKVYPVPDKNDFRVNLSKEDIEIMKVELEENLQKTQVGVNKAVWRKLYDVVKKMSDTLGDEDKQFHKSLVDNIKSLCEILPELNILEDPLLETLKMEVVEKLTITSPEVLRDDIEKRNDVAKNAEDLAKRMSAYAF